MPTHPQTPNRPAAAQGEPTEDALDLRLVERIRAGDASAWTEFVRRYQDRLFSVCLRLVRDRDLAADTTQDAFIKIIQGIDKYDGRSKLSTWLIRITMNVCLSKLRSEKLRRHASLDAPAAGDRSLAGVGGSGGGSGGGTAAGPAPLDTAPTWGSQLAQNRELSGARSVELDQERATLLAALRRVDDEQRAILILRDGHGLEYEHIAETLGVAVGTVKSRLFRARLALREAIEHLEAQANNSPGPGRRAMGS